MRSPGTQEVTHRGTSLSDHSVKFITINRVRSGSAKQFVYLEEIVQFAARVHRGEFSSIFRSVITYLSSTPVGPPPTTTTAQCYFRFERCLGRQEYIPMCISRAISMSAFGLAADSTQSIIISRSCPTNSQHEHRLKEEVDTYPFSIPQLFHEDSVLFHAGNVESLSFRTDCIDEVVVGYGRRFVLTFDIGGVLLNGYWLQSIFCTSCG